MSVSCYRCGEITSKEVFGRHDQYAKEFRSTIPGTSWVASPGSRHRILAGVSAVPSVVHLGRHRGQPFDNDCGTPANRARNTMRDIALVLWCKTSPRLLGSSSIRLKKSSSCARFGHLFPLSSAWGLRLTTSSAVGLRL
jgi:hypothetical protein